MLLYFLLYLAFVIIYIIQKLNPLKINEVKKILMLKNSDSEQDNKNSYNIDNNYDESKSNNVTNIKMNENNINNKGEQKKNNIRLIDSNRLDNYKEKVNNAPPIKKLSTQTVDNTFNNNQTIKNKESKDYFKMDTPNLKLGNNNGKKHKRSIKNRKYQEIETKNYTLNINSIDLLKVTEIKLSELEINNLDYEEALKFDKRSFINIYWSIVKREVIILLITFLWNDYNLLNLKLARLVFILCTYMAMNVIFFSDDSIHKIYLNNGKYIFGDHIPKIIFSIIITKVLEVFVCYLTLTDKFIYRIIGFKIDQNGKNEGLKIFKYINIKIIIYFVVSFLLIIFYWYIVIAFCAVYENLQIILIENYLLSLLFSLIYPFILYLLPTGLRIMALKSTTKKFSNIIYKLSTFIPIF